MVVYLLSVIQGIGTLMTAVTGVDAKSTRNAGMLKC